VHATASGYQARAAAIAQALEGCTSQQAPSRSHTIPAAKKRHTAGPKPRAKPKPKPAAKATPIKVYTPKPSAPSPAPKRVAHRASGKSVWAYVIFGAALVVILGLAWWWRGSLRNRNLRTPI
jgi:cobalamin biosynthesis Mg chelatase CobN